MAKQMKGLIIILLFFIITGCRRNEGVPGNIIARDQMENILWDMIQADQFSAHYLIKDSTRINARKETIKLYGQVFRIHNISKDEFQKSFQYYLSRPDLTEKMLDTLSERARRQRLAENQKPIPPKSS